MAFLSLFENKVHVSYAWSWMIFKKKEEEKKLFHTQRNQTENYQNTQSYAFFILMFTLLIASSH